MIGIYKITNTINHKFYIGQSNNINRRFSEHKNLNHEKCPSLLAAYKKYGVENFTFEVLEECKIEELDDREMYYIELLNPQYNRTKGGCGVKGRNLSDEVKKRLSEKGKKQWDAKSDEEKKKFIKNNLKGWRKGHPVSEYVRQRVRETHLGTKQPKELIEKRMATMKQKKLAGWKRPSVGKKKVLCVESGVVFESVKAAGAFLGIPPTRVSSVLCGDRKGGTLHGFHFVYLKGVETNPDECKGVGKKSENLLEVQDNSENC